MYIKMPIILYCDICDIANTVLHVIDYTKFIRSHLVLLKQLLPEDAEQLLWLVGFGIHSAFLVHCAVIKFLGRSL